jgi:two-component system, sensor histidine kinase and response regulator
MGGAHTPRSLRTPMMDLQEDRLGRPTSSENAIPCVNQNVLAGLRALSKARGRDLVSELSGTFFVVLPERLDAINAAAALGDAKAFAAVAHKLKGGAACIGADRLAALCGRLESMGDAGSLEGAQTLIEELKREAKNLREALTPQSAAPTGQP